MSRSRGIWLIVTCLGVALGCGEDVTAPTGTLEVILTPATVRRSYYDSTQNGSPASSYSEAYSNPMVIVP
jgi:hypothetical protein